MRQILAWSIGMALGSVIYDFISRGPGSIQWGKALFVWVFSALVYWLVERFRRAPSSAASA